MEGATKTDVGANKWIIDDVPFRVRHWASDVVHLLPDDPAVEVVVGRDPACGIQLSDHRVSKRHARLYHRDKHWRMRDLGTKNRLVVDGSPCDEVALEPGRLIEIGGVTWIVESRLLVEVRRVLSRLIGYGTDKLADVDLAVRAVRKAAIGQAPLVLGGDGDLVAIARMLHRRVIGEARPFIVCDPRRRRTGATVRSAENYREAVPAMQAAIGGTLCFWSDRVPQDFAVVSRAHREPNARFQLVMCGHKTPYLRPHQVAPIAIVPLAGRTNELERIVHEYAADARAALGVSMPLHPVDRGWIAASSAPTHPELEKSAQRVIAMRATNGNIAAAAAMLGMSHSSLMRWLAERRPLPDLDAADRVDRSTAPAR